MATASLLDADEPPAYEVVNSTGRGRAILVCENDPYPVALDEDFTVPVHAETRGLPYVLFEIRQDQLMAPAGIEEWASRLARMLSQVLEDPLLDDLAAPAPDVHLPRYAEEI